MVSRRPLCDIPTPSLGDNQYAIREGGRDGRQEEDEDAADDCRHRNWIGEGMPSLGGIEERQERGSFTSPSDSFHDRLREIRTIATQLSRTPPTSGAGAVYMQKLGRKTCG